ncbi:MAG: hypothetical protein ABSC91_10555 [Candidatus Bathyarchaeia archaeon]|jgi:hypothetical protein
MSKKKLTPVFVWLLIASVLMIVNGALISFYNGPMMVSSGSPPIVRFSDWGNFAATAVNATSVSVLHQEPDPAVLVEALKTFTNPDNSTEDKLLTFEGSFPGNRTVRGNQTLLNEWVVTELTVDPTTVRDNITLSLTAISNEPFWWRFVSGIPGTVEGGAAYIWLFLAVLVLAIDMLIYMKPRNQKRFAPAILVFSLLSLPIGGGFIIGMIIGLIVGLAGLEWPKNFQETFIGRIFNVARLNAESLKILGTDAAKMQTAVLTVIFVAVLSSLGVGIYILNVNLMHVPDTYAALKSTYSILVQGAVFTGVDAYFGATAYITVGILKWLILSIIVYLVGAKVLGLEFKFRSMATILAFVYVPEILQMFTPFLFTNEPMLSKGALIILIPVTWPLALFYISRIWAFVILIFAIRTIMDLTTMRALGVGLFTGTIYTLVNYLYVYPTLNPPGLAIQFSNSSVPILILASVAILVAFFLGIFKKQV